MRPCGFGKKSDLAKRGRLQFKAKEKIEKALDVETIHKDHKALRDMKFLLLDDPYVRKLLKIQRSKHIKIDTHSGSTIAANEEDRSDASSEDIHDIQETLNRAE
jgi:hypothetical protein